MALSCEQGAQKVSLRVIEMAAQRRWHQASFESEQWGKASHKAVTASVVGLRRQEGRHPLLLRSGLPTPHPSPIPDPQRAKQAWAHEFTHRGQRDEDPPEVAGCVGAQSILQGLVIV